MHLNSERREKIAIAILYCVLGPLYVILKITEKISPKAGDRFNDWIENRLERPVCRLNVWINDTPEKTMELLKKTSR